MLVALVPAALALAKPAFQTGDYEGTVATAGKPTIEFVATKRRVKRIATGGIRATCADGRVGGLNLPGSVAKRWAKLRKARFDLRFSKARFPAQAGTRVTGRLKERSASGTLRIMLRVSASSGNVDPEGTVVCDTGKRKWTATPDEVELTLP
jgi:hypothetical protein